MVGIMEERRTIKMKNIFESKKEDFEIKEYKIKIKNINDNNGHFYFDAKNKKIINLNKKREQND